MRRRGVEVIFVHQICLAVCKSQIQKNFRGNWNFYQFQFKWWNFFLLKSDEEDRKKAIIWSQSFFLLKDAFCHVLATLSCYMYSPCHQCKTFPKYFFLGFHFLIFTKRLKKRVLKNSSNQFIDIILPCLCYQASREIYHSFIIWRPMSCPQF